MNRNPFMLALAGAVSLGGVSAALAGQNCVSDYACTTGEFRTHDNLSSAGLWNALSTWQECLNDQDGWWCDATEIPGSSDDVTIRKADVVQVKGGRACNDLTIESNGGSGDPGELQVFTGGGKLTVYGDVTVLVSGIPGLIKFVDGTSTSTPAELELDSTATVADIENAATGEGGKITVNSSYTLTVSGDLDVVDGLLTSVGSVTLTGDATISGGNFTSNGTFQNDGTFTLSGTSADVAEFKGTGGIASGSSGDWTVNNANATLRISTASTLSSTGADIQFDAGTIDVDADFKVNGELSWKGPNSTFEVAANKVFEAFSGDLPQ